MNGLLFEKSFSVHDYPMQPHDAGFVLDLVCPECVDPNAYMGPN